MRSNQISLFLEDIWTREDLTFKAKPTRWSLMEIIEHLNVIYGIYLPLFDDVLSKAAPLEDEAEVSKTSILGWLSIYTTKPRKGRRAMKMKTMKYLEPHVEQKDEQMIIEKFKANKNQFNEVLRRSRTLNIGNIKMETSLGPRVKLYVLECLEFVLVHEERHTLQIKELTQAGISTDLSSVLTK